MKLIKYLLLFLGTSSISYAQNIVIKNSETKEPLESAILISEISKTVITTNSKGVAEISDFTNSERIQIRAIGYKMLIKSYREIQSLNFEIFLEPSSVEIDEVVISATRWGQLSGNIPSKVTKISSREMALQNPQTAADLLGASGEVFIQKSQQGGGSPMVRGFSSNRLLYTVDGIRMNSAIFRAGNIQNVISLDPLAIENTEVLFGPGSIIYGSDAIGGVMSFKTLTPQFSKTDKALVKGNALGRYSSANKEKTMHFDVNVGWKKWSYLSSASHSEFGDLRMGTHGPTEYLRPHYVIRMDSADRVVSNPDPLVQNPTGYSQINLMQKLSFKFNEKWDFHYGFHYSKTSEYSRYDRLIETQSNGLPRSAVWNYGPQKWSMNQFEINHKNNFKLYDQMTLRLAQQTFEENRIDRNFSGEQRFRLRTNLEEVQAYSANLDFEKHSGKHQFYYGAEFVQNDVQSFGSALDIRNNQAIPVADRYPTSHWKSYAAYLNYQYILSSQFIIQSGIRFNAFDLESDFTRHLSFFLFDFTSSRIQNSSTNGSIGAVYRPDESWKISFNASTGFRAPNVDDVGKIFDFAAGDVVVPNTSLKAEYAYNGEINIAKVFAEQVKIDITGFYTYLDNAMVRRTFQVNGKDSILYGGIMSRVYAIQNAAKATVYGFNFGIDIKLPGGFGLHSRFNYQLGEEETDGGIVGRSRHAAPAFGVTRLNFQKEVLSLELNAMYCAEVSAKNLNEEEKQKPFIYAKDQNGNLYSPAWYTLNFKAMYKVSESLSISAGVENLTDQRYRPYSSGIVAAGRNLVMSVRTQF